MQIFFNNFCRKQKKTHNLLNYQFFKKKYERREKNCGGRFNKKLNGFKKSFFLIKLQVLIMIEGMKKILWIKIELNWR